MTSPPLRFQNFELDPAQFELRRAGHRVRLERKPLELLILLAEKRGNLVSREEIVQRVWGDDVYFDAERGINNAVRLLLCGDDLDDIVGMVRMRDLINQLASGQPIALEAACVQVLSIHESTTALRLLELFRNAPSHLAVVLDEYGSIEGVVTPSDVLSAVTGQLIEASDTGTNVLRREDGSWLVDGRVRVVEAERAIGAYDWAGKNYTTVAGLVLDRLGHLPKTGEKVAIGAFTLEVVDMDGRRIDKLLVSRQPDA